ncbi:MAG TPA: head-tail connector protein [Anaerolineae bacterium]|nr:head-tail connector protein [Anaerolineae bacterium]
MLQVVKDYLKITWNDEDAHIQGIIDRGQAYLNDLTGAELDFEADGPPKTLLLDYCRYVYNNASEYFEENFARELLRLQLQEGIKAMPEVVPDEV